LAASVKFAMMWAVISCELPPLKNPVRSGLSTVLATGGWYEI
jgi:hypothetical protein